MTMWQNAKGLHLLATIPKSPKAVETAIAIGEAYAPYSPIIRTRYRTCARNSSPPRISTSS